MENPSISYYMSLGQYLEKQCNNYANYLEQIGYIYRVTTHQQEGLTGYDATLTRTNEKANFYCDVRSERNSSDTLVLEYQLSHNCPSDKKEIFSQLFFKKLATRFCVLGKQLAYALHISLYNQDVIETNMIQNLHNGDYLQYDLLNKVIALYEKSKDKFKTKSAAFFIIRNYVQKENAAYLTLIDGIFGQKLN